MLMFTATLLNRKGGGGGGYGREEKNISKIDTCQVVDVE